MKKKYGKEYKTVTKENGENNDSAATAVGARVAAAATIQR